MAAAGSSVGCGEERTTRTPAPAIAPTSSRRFGSSQCPRVPGSGPRLNPPAQEPPRSPAKRRPRRPGFAGSLQLRWLAADQYHNRFLRRRRNRADAGRVHRSHRPVGSLEVGGSRRAVRRGRGPPRSGIGLESGRRPACRPRPGSRCRTSASRSHPMSCPTDKQTGEM